MLAASPVHVSKETSVEDILGEFKDEHDDDDDAEAGGPA